jgi:hypothetical protein
MKQDLKRLLKQKRSYGGYTMTFASHILSFIKNLSFPVALPDEIKVMNPFLDRDILAVCECFYERYYCDHNNRWMIIGINPGRFGGGVTGIPFTDPVRLQSECGIENSWSKKQELSSLFIYEIINAFGGPEVFYKKFYFTAVSPLGFTRNNKNLNYYDDKIFENGIKDFAVDCMIKQLKFGINCDVVFCLGDGKNYKYLSKLNAEHKFFKQIIPLSHPRFIMQYKLKSKSRYVQSYLRQFAFCNRQ